MGPPISCRAALAPRSACQLLLLLHGPHLLLAVPLLLLLLHGLHLLLVRPLCRLPRLLQAVLLLGLLYPSLERQLTAW